MSTDRDLFTIEIVFCNRSGGPSKKGFSTKSAIGDVLVIVSFSSIGDIPGRILELKIFRYSWHICIKKLSGSVGVGSAHGDAEGHMKKKKRLSGPAGAGVAGPGQHIRISLWYSLRTPQNQLSAPQWRNPE